MSEQPSMADEIRELTVRIKGLTALQSELAGATKRLHSTLVFATHPELAQLDDEFNNLYPEAPGDR